MGFFPAGVFRGKKVALPLTPRCDLCRLCDAGCNSPKMAARGDGSVPVLFVLGYPDVSGDMVGKPVSGRGADWLYAVLRKLGVSPEDAAVTSAVRCRPTDKAGMKKLTQAVQHCRPNVMADIERLKPRVIIPMGSDAVRSVLLPFWRDGKKDSMTDTRWAGWQIPLHKLNAYVCPTYDLDDLTRAMAGDGLAKNQVKGLLAGRQIAAAVKLADEELPESVDRRKLVRCVFDDDRAAKIVRKVNDCGGLVAFDYETDRLKPDAAASQVVCCSLRWQSHCWTFPWTTATAAAMRDLLANPAVGKIASNLKFEHRWTLRHLKVRVKNWCWDTMQTSHILDHRAGVSSIKFQAFVNLGEEQYDADIHPYLEAKEGKRGNAANRIKLLDLRRLYEYCGLDSYLEYEVCLRQAAELGVDPLTWRDA